MIVKRKLSSITKKALPMVLSAAVLVLVFAACSKPVTEAKKEPVTSRIPTSVGKTLATVNGVAITEYDIQAKPQRGSHNKEITPGAKRNTLEAIIREELLYQKAVELGLDNDSRYMEKLAKVNARINNFKREEMAKLFYRKQITEKAVITDEEARKYFEENKELIQTEINIWQILYSNNEKAIKEALEKIESGAPFIDVAKERFPNLSESNRPWDLGYLHWNQIPDAWRGVVDKMEIGEVSGIIKGPRNRFWIVKLIDKRVNPDIDFENQKKNLKNVLKTKKIRDLNEKSLKELREKAKIVYLSK